MSSFFARDRLHYFQALLRVFVLLASHSVTVHAVLTGPVDTDMNRGFDIPKASPESAADAIFDGLERGDEDIFPDPLSQSIANAERIFSGQSECCCFDQRIDWNPATFVTHIPFEKWISICA